MNFLPSRASLGQLTAGLSAVTSLAQSAASIGGALSAIAGSALSGATPLVTFRIRAGGSALPASCQVRGINVMCEVNRVPTARLVLLDGDPTAQDFTASAESVLQPGSEIEILAGYDSKDESLFKGIVTRLRIRATQRGGPELHIECKDKCISLTKGRRSTCHSGKTDSVVIASLIKKAGLKADVSSTSVTHEELVQFNATDWDFIATRAEANGMVILVKDGTVAVKEPATHSPAVVDLSYGKELFEFEAQLEDHDHDSASAESWNAKTQEPEKQGTASGATSALQHGGERPRDELKTWISATNARAKLAQLRGRARVQGKASLLPGQVVKLSGMGSKFSGKSVFVSAVAHEITGGDWFTDVQFGLSTEPFHQRPEVVEPPAGGLLPAVTGLQIGLVTKITDDPQKEFRVRVKLPLIDASGEGVWARIARLDAGAERGVVFLPEIGDEVVLGFLHGDPRDAVVLGMMHSSKNAAPIAAEEKNAVKGITTRSKMQLLFDDEKKLITLAVPEGPGITLELGEEQQQLTLTTHEGPGIVLDQKNKKITVTDKNDNIIEMSAEGIKLTGKKHIVDLAEAGVTITSDQDLTLTAKGKITIKSKGGDVELEASGKLTAKGTGGVNLGTKAAVTTIEGQTVNIN